MKLLKPAIFAVALSSAQYATAQYQFTEDFELSPLPTGADAWIAQFGNAGGGYNDGDIGGSLGGADIIDAASSTIGSNGGYLNFYARYDDAGILQSSLFRNLGGFAGSDPYSANNGTHTLTACVYVPQVADFGADFAAGVDAGLGVRISGTGYSQWPGDLNFNHSLSISNLPREQWTRVSLTFDIIDGSRVDAGVWVTNPSLAGGPINTGVFYDEMWLGAAANAPTTACYTPPAPPSGGGSGGSFSSPTAVPALPLWSLAGLSVLVGLLGWSRRKPRV